MPLSDADFDLWLSLSEAPTHPGLFFVGTFDSRITFFSQQVRSLRLIHALRARGRLPQNQQVAVIGGGAAGLTAALAAALAGADVTLYERSTGLLQLQSGSPRLLHPHIYEWPERGSLQPDAILPFLDWTRASGAVVKAKLEANYASAKTGIKLAEQLRWTLTKLQRVGDEWSLTFLDADGVTHERTVPTVILTIGFGEELGCGDAPKLDYWRHAGLGSGTVELADSLFFVSGSGDGGLTDALAVLIKEFEHLAFTEAFLDRLGRAELAKAVETAEAGVPFNGDLWPSYEEHVLPVLTSKGLLEFMTARLRDDRKLVLNADPLLAKGKAARLNQVMVFALVQAAKSTPGLLRRSTGAVEGVTKTGAHYQVEGPLEGVEPLTDAFDMVVLRHGPDKAKRFGPAGLAYEDYRAHHEQLVADNPHLADPPRIDPETYEEFDRLFTSYRPDPGDKHGREAAAAARQRTILLSRDPAFHQLVQQGARDILAVAETIDVLPEPVTVLLAAPPGESKAYDDILQRLAKASNGRLTISVSSTVHASWQAAGSTLIAVPGDRSPYPAQPLPPPESLWSALEASLIRMLDERLANVAANQHCDELGDIHPTIVAVLQPTWAEWRTHIDADPDLRSDFLRLLFQVEVAGKDRWNGDHACLPSLTSALVLMLATHAEVPLIPSRCSPGNVQFGDGAVGLGSGCSKIGGRPIEDYQDAEGWSVDALILSQARSEMFTNFELLTEAGANSKSLTRARRLPPAVIPNTRPWRERLGQDLAAWRAAVGEEFDRWRKGQDEALEDS